MSQTSSIIVEQAKKHRLFVNQADKKEDKFMKFDLKPINAEAEKGRIKINIESRAIKID